MLRHLHFAMDSSQTVAMRYLWFLTLFVLPILAWSQVRLHLPADPVVEEVPLDWRGHNLSAAARMSWVTHPEFEALLPALRPGFIRWPYGNPANDYDWFGGLADTGGFHLAHAAAFARAHATRLQAVVPFGNQTAAHAAQLVQWCNSTEAPWPALRDSLLGSPEPLHIELWEIGNEVTTAWGFGWSWLGYQPVVRFRTGQPPLTWTRRQIDSLYFYGGAFPRFGWVERVGGLNARTAFLGDLVFVPQGSDTLLHRVRFPYLSPHPDSVRVWLVPAIGALAVDEATPQQDLYDFVTEAQHLLSQSDYMWDTTTFRVFPPGGIPDSSALLFEYLSVGHDGAFQFIDAMRAADPGIRIGICTDVREELAVQPQFAADFAQHLPDFVVAHPYATTLTVPAAAGGLHSELVWVSAFKMQQMLDRQQRWRQRAQAWQLPWVPGLALTEWNVALCDECPDPHPFRGMGGALYTARFQARAIELAAADSILLHASNHFAMLASGQNFLHLFHVNGGQFDIGNEGWAMLMVMEVLAEGIVSPTPPLEDVPMLSLQQPDGTTLEVPALEAWVGFRQSEAAWRVLLLHTDTEEARTVRIHLPEGYWADTVVAHLLTGTLDGAVTNWSAQQWLVQADSFTVVLPPYSLMSLAFRQMSPPVGVEEAEQQPSWQVHAARDVGGGGVRLFAEARRPVRLHWRLLRLDGRLVTRGRLDLPQGQAQPLLSVPELSAGAYLLHLYDKSHQLALKLVAFGR